MVIERLSTYISGALAKPLPQGTREAAEHHILDTLAAIVSGSRLAAGRAGAAFVQDNAAAPEAMVIGTELITNATNAALANAMSAHADETDDSHAPSLTHPGCAVVPAALAVAERNGRSGEEFLRAVVLGYDLCGRITRSLWPDFAVLRSRGHSSHAIGSLWGAAAAAAALAGLDENQVRYAIAYTVQQTAGVWTWLRDVEHIEKAYAFGGLGASNGVRAVTFVEAGWPGVRDSLSGVPNFFDAFGQGSHPELLIDGLGERFVIDETNIKRFSVGSPVQAPAQGLLDLLHEQNLDSDGIAKVEITMSSSAVDVVLGRDMGDISISYLLSVVLADRELTFSASHDMERFARWQQNRDERIVVQKSDAMDPTKRQALVEITTREGATHRRHVTAVRGTADNPMPRSEVVAKATDLCADILGGERTTALVKMCLSLDTMVDVRALRGPLSIDEG